MAPTLRLTTGQKVAALLATAEQGAIDHRSDLRLSGFEHDKHVTEAGALVAEAPDSPSRVRALAAVLDERAQEGRHRAELEEVIAQARAQGVDVDTVAQQVLGSGDVLSVLIDGEQRLLAIFDARQSSADPRRGGDASLESVDRVSQHRGCSDRLADLRSNAGSIRRPEAGA